MDFSIIHHRVIYLANAGPPPTLPNIPLHIKCMICCEPTFQQLLNSLLYELFGMNFTVLPGVSSV